MKRFFATIITIVLAGFMLWGCSKSAVKTNVEPAQAPKNAEAAQTSALPVKTADQAKMAPTKLGDASMQDQQSKKVAAQAAADNEKQFADIHFDLDKYNLNSGERAKLDKIAAWLKKNKDCKVRIEGNCDERGSAEYNLALGERRATAAMQYLADLGIEKDRISTISYGKEKPLDPGHDEAAWAKNRRDHFLVIKM